MKRLAFALVVATPLSLAAQPVSQKVGHGEINWSDKTVTATGSGAPNLKAANVAVARLGAERAAKMDAFRNILEAVRGVRISGEQSAGAAIDASPELKSKIEGIVRGFKVIDTRYYSDGGVDVVLQGPIDGVLAEALVTGAGSKQGSGAPPADGTTGIIINAKGLGATPALAPRLLDESGGELYAASMVKVDTLRKRGAVAYAKSLDAAGKDERVGGKPLIVKAVRLATAGSSDLVIGAADVGKVKKAEALLGEAKVIIVTD